MDQNASSKALVKKGKDSRRSLHRRRHTLEEGTVQTGRDLAVSTERHSTVWPENYLAEQTGKYLAAHVEDAASADRGLAVSNE
jgi:hypothetical protein